MASVLHDRTNSDSPILQPSKTIRRVQSGRMPRFHLGSDETIPSEHSSVYDAHLVVSTEDVDPEGKVCQMDPPTSPVGLPLSPSLENLDQLADLPHKIQVQEAAPTSHSNWPSRQLETITEQRSISTLYTSVSLPRLNTAELINDSSITRHHTHWPLNSSPATKPFNRRSFSENDASCLPFPTWKAKSSVYKAYQSDSSSSSEELNKRQCITIWPVYPLKPKYPPPQRSPTPPGLPTFGTREAVQLLHEPRIRGASGRNIQGRPSTRVGLPETVAERHPVPVVTATPRPCDPSNSTKGNSITRRIIRSLCRSSSDELPEDDEGRVGLPASFVARADDGTLVRGRFGARNSGHGVGARAGQQDVGLEGHPFHRLEPAERPLETEVGEIDKACDAIEGSRPQGVDVSLGSGRRPGAQGARLQRPEVLHNRSARTSTANRQPFWSGRVNGVAAPAGQEGGIPVASRMHRHSGPVNLGRMLQRRMSAQSIILAAKLEEEQKRKQHSKICEARCWSWACWWCCKDRMAGKQEARALFEEDRRMAIRRSPHMLESEEPVLPNARIVYPTLFSEEFTN
jgi:hypothetical protein